MLAEADAMATVGVRDIAAARAFYGQVLGLREGDPGDCKQSEILFFASGRAWIQVYRSDYAGTNRATAITWDVGERIGEVVAALKARGARFEHYQLEGMRLEGDIHVGEGIKAAWLKDPDGNVLNISGK